ncbi:cytochrome b6-f complex subunit PetP [Stanieria sp. NIES-3757]|nr:cytochrome b6-f complex subunit PetP [Stanieria sp. NIES-3757]
MAQVISEKSRMEIGQKVKVYRLRDRLSPNVVSKLGKTGVIKNFKMTDGSGVGVIVEFDDKSATWFFEDEIKPVE